MIITRSTRRIFEGHVVNLRVDEVEFDNGHRSTFEIVEHRGGVAIIAQPEPNKILLVKQFRPAPGTSLWEVPAGKLEANEDPLESAKRELLEETGYSARTMRRLWSFYTSPGFSDELIHLFLAEGLTLGTCAPEESEFIEVQAFDVEDVYRMIEHDELRDAKTQIAVGWLRSSLRQR